MTPLVFIGFAGDFDCVLRKDRGSEEERAVVLPAVETMANPDPERASRRDNPNLAAKASRRELIHLYLQPSQFSDGTFVILRGTM